MAKPNFLIVGVARCGTTSLYHYLKQHPDVGFPKIKEPKFFSVGAQRSPQFGPGDNTVWRNVITEEKEYFDLFSRIETSAIGEASSNYFYYHRHVIPLVKEKLGDVKIIICLRNPYDRAFSAYQNLVRDGREDLEFHDALVREKSRREANFDWMWHYSNGSLYAEGVRAFITSFTNVKIVFFEDLQKNPSLVCKQCFKFLDVSEEFKPDVSTKYSHSGRPRNLFLRFLMSRTGPMFFLRDFAIKIVPRYWLESLSGLLLSKDIVDTQSYEIMKDKVDEDIDELSSILKTDIAQWKKI